MGAPESTTAKPPAQLASPVSPPASGSVPAASNNSNNLQGRHVSSFMDWLPQEGAGIALTCMSVNMLATSLKLGLEVCEAESTCCKVVYCSWSLASLSLSCISQCFVYAINTPNPKEKQQ